MTPRPPCLYIAYQTGWFGLHRRAGLRPGETLLVHAAAGGVGSAAIQLGKAAGAARDRRRRRTGQGRGRQASSAPTSWSTDTSEDFVEVVKEATGGRGADVVYDPVGGDDLPALDQVHRLRGPDPGGRLRRRRHPGRRAEPRLVKNYSIVGLHWGLYNRHDPAAVQVCHRDLTGLADQGLSSRWSASGCPSTMLRPAYNASLTASPSAGSSTSPADRRADQEADVRT